MTDKKKRTKGLRKDNRILRQLTVGRNPDGSAIKKNFYGKTISEAEAKRDAYKRELSIGMDMSETKMTVSEWISRWIVAYKVDTEAYAPYINRLNKDLGRYPIRAITEAHLVSSLSNFENKSTSGATKYKMILKQIFRKARKNKIIPEDPSDDLELPKNTTAGSHRCLEPWETDCIFENWKAHRAGLWGMIMLLSGLRRSELIALDWSDIDLDKRIIDVNSAATRKLNKDVVRNSTKTKAGTRKVPICDPLKEALESTPKKLRRGPVCRNSYTNKRITLSGFDSSWKTFQICMTRIINGEDPDQQGRRTDLKSPAKPEKIFAVRPHDLRHTYATALYDAGVDLKSAQYYLGHDDISMTQQLYTHLSTEREKESRSTLVNYLDTWFEKRENTKKNGSDSQKTVKSE